MKAHYLLVQNIRTLLQARGVSAKDLAQFAGHSSPWLSRILTGDRGLRFEDLDKVADFFGLTPADLFSYGIAALTERRKSERRKGPRERRVGERRQPHAANRLYGGALPPWRPKPPKQG